MAAPVLVSLGAQQEGGVPTSLQPLFDEGVFEEGGVPYCDAFGSESLLA